MCVCVCMYVYIYIYIYRRMHVCVHVCFAIRMSFRSHRFSIESVLEASQTTDIKPTFLWWGPA